MSWDVFVFNSSRIVNDIADLEESLLVEIGTWQEFKQLIRHQFPNALFVDNWCKIEEKEFSLETSLGLANEKVSNTIFHLYGANAIYALAALCQRNNWQAFDSSADSMLNLSKPEENGYQNLVAYLAQIKQQG